MIIPYLRQDLEILRGNSREDGSPAWLLYDAIRNKYFTLGITAFRLIKNWKGGEDLKKFEKKLIHKALRLILRNKKFHKLFTIKQFNYSTNWAGGSFTFKTKSKFKKKLAT